MLVRKLPVVVDAVQWHGGDEAALRDLRRELGVDLGDERLVLLPDGCLDIQTQERAMLAVPSAWIIKGVDGELYPCQDSIFRKNYEFMS